MICPHCGRRNDLHTGAAGTRPRPGDVSICWACAGIGIYVAGDSARVPTAAEVQELAADPRIAAAQAAIREHNTPHAAAFAVWPDTTTTVTEAGR